ncbi:MAG: peptidylprolyl isomerase [Acidimicrobiales bacterium]|jgi:cyclophilin family peptidyl-prolyl cis-trans isomerase|nr:peptidylprolyl isomerase [Acidimicrobiales bacterium]
MGTAKRERQKAGHQARLSAEAAARTRAERRRRLTITIALAAFVVAVVAVLTLVNRDDSSNETASTTTSTTAATDALVPPAPGPGASITGATPCPATDGSAERTTSFAEPPPMCIDPARTYTATFTTSVGTITATLDTTTTPETTNNFVVLARYKFYDGSAIFRADQSIEIVQGGAPTTNSPSDPGPGYTIPDEGGPFTYRPGQLVMARTSQPNSAGAQFFLTGGPAVSSLDAQGTYVVFGTTDEAGTALVTAMLATAVENPNGGGLGGVPDPPVVIESVTISES